MCRYLQDYHFIFQAMDLHAYIYIYIYIYYICIYIVLPLSLSIAVLETHSLYITPSCYIVVRRHAKVSIPCAWQVARICICTPTCIHQWLKRGSSAMAGHGDMKVGTAACAAFRVGHTTNSQKKTVGCLRCRGVPSTLLAQDSLGTCVVRAPQVSMGSLNGCRNSL
jgi:hypothetical protein